MTDNGSSANRPASPGTPFTLGGGSRVTSAGRIDIDTQHRWEADDPALVSCLMVTRDRPWLAARSIECFLAQSYPNRELVIIDSSAADELGPGIAALCYPPINLHRVEQGSRSLGELRNLAVEKSRGQYVCHWDDDDLSDPDRLSVQMTALTRLAADACFLTREQLWWPARRILAVSTSRLWESTMICAKDKMPRYPPIRRGEDTAVAYHLWRCGTVVMLDEPRLYTYVFHGSNTFDEAHFDQHFAAATERWCGEQYADRLTLLATRVPVDTCEQTAAEHADQPVPLIPTGLD